MTRKERKAKEAEKIDNGFGRVEIRPVIVRKKSDIITVAKSSGSCSGGYGEVLTGKYKGQIVVFDKKCRSKVNCEDKTRHFVTLAGILGILELAEDDVVEDPFEVNPSYGIDMTWYGA